METLENGEWNDAEPGEFQQTAFKAGYEAGCKEERERVVDFLLKNCEEPILFNELVWRAENTPVGETTIEIKLKHLHSLKSNPLKE